MSLNAPPSFINWLHQTFNLSRDQASPEKIDLRIREGIDLVGSTAWILIFAILIASIGLNVNSTAVIIGAMLISPLMGPILGVGYGAATYDMALVKKALVNLAVAVIISLIASTLYFTLSPLTTAQSELLARTSPTIWDVLIAFFGGMAGIIGLTRKERSNVLPGVAIATALMPPLCTAGYGLATHQWQFIIGAFYLFLINAVFIAAATYIVCQLMKFPDHQYVNGQVQKKMHRIFWLVTILTALPSLYLAYQLVQGEVYQQQATRLVKHHLTLPNHYIAKTEIHPESRQIILTLIGKPLSSGEMNHLQAQVNKSQLAPTSLLIRQANNAQPDTRLLQENTQALALLQAQEKELQQLRGQDRDSLTPESVQQLLRELQVQFPEVQELVLGQGYHSTPERDQQQVNLVHLLSSTPVRPAEKQKIESWFKIRTGLDPVFSYTVQPQNR